MDYKEFIDTQIEDLRARIDDSFNLTTWEEENEEEEDVSDWTIDNEPTLEDIFIEQ